MKKISLLFSFMTLCIGLMYAQTTFWTETFGSGIPSGWTNTGTPVNGMWKTTRNGNKGYAQTIQINSPTKANGFLIFDGDSLDNGGGGSQGSGPAPARQTGVLKTTPINCSAHPRVLLQFYEMFYNYAAKTQVVISNGTTTDTIDVNGTDYDFTFARTPNALLKQYDISAIAGGQANVTITFIWNNGLYYYWMIDDVSLLDAPANDLAISRAGSYNYYSYPLSQLDTITYYARVTNIGSVNQPNTRASVKITKGATVYYTDTTPMGVTLPVGIDSPIYDNSSWLPAMTAANRGTYTSVIKVFSDSTDAIPSDNIDSTTFAISDSVYATDNGVYGGSFSSYFAGGTSGPVSYEWANLFDVIHADTLTSVLTAFDGIFSNYSSTGGAMVQAKIYSVDPNTGAVTQVAATYQKMITSSSFTTNVALGKVVVLGLDKTQGNPVLQPGLYAVSIISVSNDSDISVVNSSKEVFGRQGGEIAGGIFTPYRNTHFFIRMSFGKASSPLACSMSVSPALNVPVYKPMIFRGTAFNTSGTPTYSWAVTSSAGTSFYNTGTNNTFKDTFRIADTYNVCLTIHDGTDSATTCQTVNVRDFGVGVADETALSVVNMTPNPTAGVVRIQADGVNGAVSISMTNMLGQEVKHFSFDTNGSLDKTYNVSDLTDGVYVVKIQNGVNVATRQLSVSK